MRGKRATVIYNSLFLMCTSEDVPLMDTHKPGKSYHRRFRSLLYRPSSVKRIIRFVDLHKHSRTDSISDYNSL